MAKSPTIQHPPLLDVYYKELAGVTILDKDVERRLLTEYHKPDLPHKRKNKIAQQVIESNLRLVFSLASSFAKRDPDKLHELICAGNEGLLIALKKFDPSYNVRFCTYAGHWVLMTMRKSNAGSLVKVPVGKSPPGYEDLTPLAKHSVYVDNDSNIQEAQTRVALETWVRFLPERERFILEKSSELMSLRDMASSLQISSERVRQLRGVALAKMRLWLSYHFPEKGELPHPGLPLQGE